MILKLINGKITSITAAAAVISGASLISRLIGVARDRLLAGQFGAGDQLDIYYAAFRLPDFVFNVIVLGGISAGFIPIFTKYLKSESDEANRLAGNVMNLLLVTLIVICGLMFIFTPQIMPLITPGYDSDKQLAVNLLSRIMFLSPVFLGISGVVGGILQSHKKFLAYSLAPVWYNLGIMFGAYFWVPRWGLVGLAWGVVLGAGLHLLLQLPTLWTTGFVYRPIFQPFTAGTVKLVRLMGPRALSLIILQLNLFIITILASRLPSGSLAIFNFANNLQSFPLGLFGVSFAVAAFPTLADQANEHDLSKFSDTVSKTFRQIIFLVIPVAAIFILLRAQIVRIILGTGAFDWQDTIITANALGIFSLSLFAQAIIPLLNRAYYALHNTLTPFTVGLVSAMINILASLLLMNVWGIIGLVLAFSLASIVNLTLLWVSLRAKLDRRDEQHMLLTFGKISLAVLLMGALVQIIKIVMADLVNMQTFVGVFTQATIAGLAGLIGYFMIMLSLKSTEARVLLQAMRKRFLKQKPSSLEIE